MHSALAPLGPVYAARLHLSGVQVGALFAAASVAMLVVTLPIGVVTDRLGARRLTLAAAALIALSALGQSVARDFWFLLGSRAVFGVGFGAVWTAGIAFLLEGDAAGRRSSVGVAIPLTGAAGALGPAFAGFAAAHFGLAVPFVAIAAAAGAAAVPLAISRAPLRAEPVEHLRVTAVLRAARGEPLVLKAAAIMFVGGFSNSLAFVLVPLRLRSNGVSVSAIGALLGAAALAYVVGGIAAGRVGARLVTPAAAGAAVLALALSLGLPALSTATASLVAFLLLRSACTAVTTTIAYPLASAAGGESGIGPGAAIAFVNVAWAMSTVVAPLMAGAVAQASSDRLAFAVVVPIALAVGAWLLRLRAPVPLPAARSRR
jgi:MFS transporter, DHA1 family, multidrug resistance protein